MIKNLQNVMDELVAIGVDSPRLEARMLVAGALQKNPDEISAFETFDVIAAKKIELLLRRRLQHEPLDKILGHRAFYKYDFLVNQDVLSPRPDTEILVEQALEILRDKPCARILDLGTGSGCIIETLLLECPQSTGVAVDISAAALRTAEQNAIRLGVSSRLKFEQKNWFDPSFHVHEQFDVIVSNPPYIPSTEILMLDPEVKEYDPTVALDGGADGMSGYRRIAVLAPKMLKDGGFILLEVGIHQAQEVAHIFSQKLQFCDIVRDLAGIERCVILQKKVAD